MEIIGSPGLSVSPPTTIGWTVNGLVQRDQTISRKRTEPLGVHSLVIVFIKTLNGCHCLPGNRLFVVCIQANVFINLILTAAKHTIKLTQHSV